MNTRSPELVEQEYVARFGDMDEISHPSLEGTAEFTELLDRALADGRALTREDIEWALGPVSWEW